MLQQAAQVKHICKTTNGEYFLLKQGEIDPNLGCNSTQNIGSINVQLSPVIAKNNVYFVNTCTKPKQATAQIQQPNTKEICHAFFISLLEFSNDKPEWLKMNVRTLVQELIDANIEPERFCDLLEELLNASRQPLLTTILENNLPNLRQSLISEEIVLNGIRPPNPSVLATQKSPFVLINQQSVAQQVMVRIQTNFSASNETSSICTQPFASSYQNDNHSLTLTPIVSQNPLVVGEKKLVKAKPRNETIISYNNIDKITVPLKAQRKISRKPRFQKTPLSKQPATINSGEQSDSVVSSTIDFPKYPIMEKIFETLPLTGKSVINDNMNGVVAMDDVDLNAEKNLGSIDFAGTPPTSYKKKIDLPQNSMTTKIKEIVNREGLEDIAVDVSTFVSRAVKERLKDLVQKMSVVAEHRLDFSKMDERYEITRNIRGQTKCLENIDKLDCKKRDQTEREKLMCIAKSQPKINNLHYSEKTLLKARAKKLLQLEMEKIQLQETNKAALNAIGPRKESTQKANLTSFLQQTPKQRIKRVTMQDSLFVLEQEKSIRRSMSLLPTRMAYRKQNGFRF